MTKDDSPLPPPNFGTNYKIYAIWQQTRFHQLMLNFQQIQKEPATSNENITQYCL